ncbi:MAG: hypothetical protein EHM13_01020 [Acidobacteria bacterium]|nr:MAG: hypothetical protein EHM13_01020 [Acidobacteriota bacterium]
MTSKHRDATTAAGLALLFAISAVSALVPRPAAAQTAPGEPLRWVSLSAGVQRPSDSMARDLYGPHVPVTIQLDLPVTRRVAVFGGGRFLRNAGTAMAVDPVFDESYPLSFRASGIRAGALLGASRGTWGLSAGGGVSRTWYRERWPDAGLEESGGVTGLLVQFGANRAIGGRLGLVARVEYEWMPAKRGEEDRIDLGSLGATAGIAFRF